MRVETLAQVYLDRQRLPPRDHPAPVHEQRAHEAQHDDRRDVETQLVRVTGRERVVDHVLRDPDQRDLTALVADREDGRDDERDLVRAQKSEQTEEGLTVARRLGHPWNLAARVGVDLRKLGAYPCGRALDATAPSRS